MIGETTVTQGTKLEVRTQFQVGTLIKFKLTHKDSSTRYSYSKIVKVLPKVSEKFEIELHFLTENHKFITQEQIISVERKAGTDEHN